MTERRKILEATAKYGQRIDLAREIDVHPKHLLYVLRGNRPGKLLAREIARALAKRGVKLDPVALRAESVPDAVRRACVPV